MPRLVYVCRNDDARDERLGELLEQVKLQVTYSPYDDPEDLYQRLRDDIEAVVADRFHRAGISEALFRSDARTAMAFGGVSSSMYLERPHLVRQIEEALLSTRPVEVTGPAGIGKTTLLAKCAEVNGFVFVFGGEISRQDLAAAIANKLFLTAGKQVRLFIDADSAYEGLLEAWTTASSFTLVLDDCRDSEFVTRFLQDVGGVTCEKRIIYSRRASAGVIGHARVPITPFSMVEIEQFIVQRRGAPVPHDEISRLAEASRGNPLYLQYYAHSEPGRYEQSIEAYESAYWLSLPPRSKEITSYLALANGSLSIGDFENLLGGDLGPETISQDAALASSFVGESPFGYSLRHEHQRDTIVSLLRSQPHTIRYYAKRLARLLEGRGDFIRAFFVLGRASLPDSLAIARPALFDALRLGDSRASMYITERVLPQARENGDPKEICYLLASRAEALRSSGKHEEAEKTLNEAASAAGKSGDESLILQMKELQLFAKLSASLDTAVLEELQQLKEIYAVKHDKLSEARISVDLSALLIGDRSK